MTRTLKLILSAAVLEMTLVALAVYAWRHGALHLPGLSAPGPAGPHTVIYFLPPWTAFGFIYGARRLASNRPRISDGHRRHLEGMLRITAAISIALQGLFAYIAVTGVTMDRDLVGRCALIFGGLWLAFNGNALAKLDPPAGDGAPPAAVWTRSLLRFGWITVVLGLAIIAAALLLPPLQQARPILIAILLAMVVVGVGLEVAYRRMTRPARTA